MKSRDIFIIEVTLDVKVPFFHFIYTRNTRSPQALINGIIITDKVYIEGLKKNSRRDSMKQQYVIGL